MKDYLPLWMAERLDIIVPVLQVIFILVLALLFKKLAARLAKELDRHYHLPREAVVVLRRTLNFVIFSSALFLILDRLGVSGTVLWTAFTGFAAVGAVAFFAAWSVLSNIFCAMLILVSRPFRLYDYVELLENGEKAGLKGQVIDMNLIYSTLRERHDDGMETVLQVPNNLFFQRTLRRWEGNSTPYQAKPAQPDMAETKKNVAAPTVPAEKTVTT